MKLNKLLISSTIVLLLLLVSSARVYAQNEQAVETQVGEVDTGGTDGGGTDGGGTDGGGTDGGGTGDDGLGPGEFKIPFRCYLKYWSWTYSGHSPYSVDINRGSGSDDRGDAVLASADGVVTDDTYKYSHGQIVIRHEGGYYTLYAHMQNVQVRKGQTVRVGQKIGEIGDTGSPGSWHLHVNHSKGSPYINSNRIKVCYKRYGCNPASIYTNTSTRYGTDYNKGC